MTCPSPFSSADGISDDDWNVATERWRGAQGQYGAPTDEGDGSDMLSGAEGADVERGGPGDDAIPTAADDDQAHQLAAFKALMARADEEGRRNDVYPDSLGKPTVGIGHLVRPEDGLKIGDKISDPQVDAYFQKDGAEALQRAREQAAQAGITDPAFIARLGAVNFQLGSKTWPGAFTKTWAKMMAGDYEGAAIEAANSKWFHQTPNRVRSFQAALRALPPRPGR